MDQFGLIFDMDGVIVDSTALHVQVWERYLRDRSMTIENIAARMLGKHNDELVRDWWGAIPDEEVFAHGAAKEALYREMLRPVFAQKLVPGVVDFVRRHTGAAMAVASNAEPKNVDFVLELAGIREHFQAVVNGHDVERPKPYPDVFLRAADMLSLPPEQCIVFEDSETGVAAAHAAGMRVVGVLTTLTRFDNVDVAICDFHDPRLERWLAGAVSPASA